ncbi:lipoprotein 17-related variable surface protein [Mycoplasma elephantis]|uniref:lipoprotein 17-related variable surface protein n=1 Tax=Mycoplasma elephantis TaxID=114882 RepID=UPI000489AB8C|nr:lipoprotein 17-related variable surface protein [Mycoplasma elephantis]
MLTISCIKSDKNGIDLNKLVDELTVNDIIIDNKDKIRASKLKNEQIKLTNEYTQKHNGIRLTNILIINESIDDAKKSLKIKVKLTDGKNISAKEKELTIDGFRGMYTIDELNKLVKELTANYIYIVNREKTKPSELKIENIQLSNEYLIKNPYLKLKGVEILSDSIDDKNGILKIKTKLTGDNLTSNEENILTIENLRITNILTKQEQLEQILKSLDKNDIEIVNIETTKPSELKGENVKLSSEFQNKYPGISLKDITFSDVNDEQGSIKITFKLTDGEFITENDKWFIFDGLKILTTLTPVEKLNKLVNELTNNDFSLNLEYDSYASIVELYEPEEIETTIVLDSRYLESHPNIQLSGFTIIPNSSNDDEGTLKVKTKLTDGTNISTIEKEIIISGFVLNISVKKLNELVKELKPDDIDIFKATEGKKKPSELVGEKGFLLDEIFRTKYNLGWVVAKNIIADDVQNTITFDAYLKTDEGKKSTEYIKLTVKVN